MNKEYLARLIKKQTGMHMHQAESIVEQILEFFVKSLIQQDQVVRIRFLGLFYTYDMKERIGRNPRTLEKAIIRARKTIKFKPDSALQASVNANLGLILRSRKFQENSSEICM